MECIGLHFIINLIADLVKQTAKFKITIFVSLYLADSVKGLFIFS